MNVVDMMLCMISMKLLRPCSMLPMYTSGNGMNISTLEAHVMIDDYSLIEHVKQKLKKHYCRVFQPIILR